MSSARGMPTGEGWRNDAEKALFTEEERNRSEQQVRMTGHDLPQHMVAPQDIEDCGTVLISKAPILTPLTRNRKRSSSSTLISSPEGIAGCTITMDQAREIRTTFGNKFPWAMFLPAIINKQYPVQSYISDGVDSYRGPVPPEKLDGPSERVNGVPQQESFP